MNASKIDKILSQMSLREKVEMLTGKGSMRTKDMPQYEIPGKSMADGPHGARLTAEHNCTHFPNLCSLAASWNVDTAKKMGDGIARDCIEHNIDMILAPGVNIKRTPQCGRNFEYFSEDPVLAGELCVGYVNGVEEKGVATSLKHFAVNNQEKFRQIISAELDERTLREIYLKAFEIVIKKANPTSVMCSYNKVNSIWTSENRFLLTEILRDEWGYDGFVVSDWGAVHNPVRAIAAGLDLQMPPDNTMVDVVCEAAENGEIEIEFIDKAVRNVLKFALKEKAEKLPYNRDDQHKTAREIAADGIVLLKNDNEILPLTSEKYKNIAVIGEYAVNPLVSGQGSAEVHQAKEYTDSPLDEIKKLLPETNFEYWELYKKGSYSEDMLWPTAYSGDFGRFISRADVVLLFAGSMTSEDSEKVDRNSIELNPNYEMIMEIVISKGKKVILVLQNGSAVVLNQSKASASAIVEMWLAGESAGGAIADVLCGVKNPCGKLPETFPTKLRTDIEYPGNGRFIEYNEKLNVGYRYYDKHTDEICYPFGHGLSYTKFEYSDLIIEKTDKKYLVTFNLKNIGDKDGAEVVQLYVGDPVTTVSKPLKELKKFKKVFLKAGEEKKITLELCENDFAYYNVMLHNWVAENGAYIIYVGASSQDIRLTAEIDYNQDMPYSLKKVGSNTMGDAVSCFV